MRQQTKGAHVRLFASRWLLFVVATVVVLVAREVPNEPLVKAFDGRVGQIPGSVLKGGAADEILIYRSEDPSSGVTRQYTASRKHLQSTKEWLPQSQEPPLTIRGAVTAAMNECKPARPGDMRVIDVEVSPVDAGVGWRWYYIIRAYDTTLTHGTAPPEAAEVVVLMDGSIVRPKKGAK